MNAVSSHLRLALAAAALFLLPPATARADDHVVYQLDWLPTAEKQAPYAGIVQGYFKEEHIELEPRRGAGAADSLTRIATGAAQYGTSDIANLMAARSEGAKVKAIMAIYTLAPHALITRKDTGIKSFADLPGHTVGTSPTASSNLFWPLVLADDKIDASKITLVNADPAALNPMLLSKRIDSAMIWVTNLPMLASGAKEAGVEMVALPFVPGGMEMYGSVVIATEQQLETQPDLTRRFLRALRRSFLYMREHPAETAHDAAAANPGQDDAIETERLKIVNQLIYGPANDPAKFGYFDPALLQKTRDWLVRAKLIEPSVKPEDFVDSRFLSPAG